MENKQTEKSQAELYREERKQRMAKAAKKNSGKSPQLTRVGNIIGKVICIVIVVALCLVAVYGCLNFFGVPQKVLSVTEINGQKISVAKYNYYYMATFQNKCNEAYSYDAQYGEGMGKMYTGYDYTTSPMEQSYTLGTLDGYENPTWADAFKESALEYIKTYVAYATLAKENGVTLTEDQQNEIDEQISKIKETAAESDYSVNRYLARQYGSGVNEKLVRQIFEEQYLAQNFAEKKQESLSDAITDKQIEAEIKENAENYMVFDISAFKIAADISDIPEDATAEEKEEALKKSMKTTKQVADKIFETINSSEAVLKAAKSLDSKATEETVNLKATTATNVTNNFGSAVAKWVFDSKRAAADKAVIEVDDGYVIAYLDSAPTTDDTKGVDVRHILVAFPTDDNGSPVTLTDTQKDAYKKTAQDILDSYLKEPTDDNFTTLASSKSDDPGSKEKGGLYENVHPGEMVTEFNDWIFDEARKSGDTDIVETKYGYHVMLYVGNDNPSVSQEAAKTALVNTAIHDFDVEATGGSDAKIERSTAIVNWTTSKLTKIITNMYIGK